MRNDRLEVLQKLPGLKGAPLSVVMALLIAQEPLTPFQLATFTGYNEKTVRGGLRTLETFRAAVNLGRGTGYALTPFWTQLPLPVGELQETETEKFTVSRPL